MTRWSLNKLALIVVKVLNTRDFPLRLMLALYNKVGLKLSVDDVCRFIVPTCDNKVAVICCLHKELIVQSSGSVQGP